MPLVTNGKRAIMRIFNLSCVRGAALLASLFAVNAALAVQESGGLPATLAEQNVLSACAWNDHADASGVCEGGLLRWRLCEQGVRSEHLPNVEVAGCFLRSL